MSHKKNKKLSDTALELIAARFRAMAEPIRLKILQELRDSRLSVNEIAAVVEASQPNVSKHLKILVDAGLLTREPQGNTVYYAIAEERLFEICDIMCSNVRKSLKDQALLLR